MFLTKLKGRSSLLLTSDILTINFNKTKLKNVDELGLIAHKFINFYI